MKQEFIYNQRRIPKEQWRYGFRSSAATGCGWIATYNALLSMGYNPEPGKLIRYYMRQLPLYNGNAGTIFFGPALYFKQRGFGVKMSARRSHFDELLKNHDVGVLFFFWRRKWKIGAHFVTFVYENGKVTGYNVFGNSVGADDCGVSLSTFLKEQKYFGCILTVVKDRRK